LIFRAIVILQKIDPLLGRLHKITRKIPIKTPCLLREIPHPKAVHPQLEMGRLSFCFAKFMETRRITFDTPERPDRNRLCKIFKKFLY
jgi:hypothetical protein